MCALVGLAALLISATKEKTFRAPIRCAVTSAFVVAGLCAALALLFVYKLQKQTWEVSRFERVHFEERVPRALSGSSLASSETKQFIELSRIL
jgi:hypothetical protein